MGFIRRVKLLSLTLLKPFDTSNYKEFQILTNGFFSIRLDTLLVYVPSGVMGVMTTSMLRGIGKEDLFGPIFMIIVQFLGPE